MFRIYEVIMNNIVPNSNDQVDHGRDSSIHAWKHYFYKEYYNHITQSILKDYNVIHRFLSQFEREIPLSIPIIYKWETICKIIFDIIPLSDDEIFHASNTRNKSKILVSTPTRIEWENLYTYSINSCQEWEYDFETDYKIIRHNILEQMSKYFPYLDIRTLDLTNIMVTKTQNWTIYCTITDLWDNIRTFIENQKEMGNFEDIIYGKIRRKVRDTSIVRWKKNGEIVN